MKEFLLSIYIGLQGKSIMNELNAGNDAGTRANSRNPLKFTW